MSTINYDAIAQHVGRPQTFSALGVEFTTARLTRPVWAEFLTWAKTQLPDPVDVAHRMLTCIDKVLPSLQGMEPGDDQRTAAMLLDAVKQQVVDAAMAEAMTHLSAFNPRVQALRFSPEGQAYMLYLLLKHQGVDYDLAWDIVMQTDVGVVEDVLRKSEGLAPPKEGGDAE